MALEHPYIIYGNVANGGAISGATVYAQGAAGTVTTTTDINGQYILDIQAACNLNGETVDVWAISPTGMREDTSFTLDLSGAAELVNLLNMVMFLDLPLKIFPSKEQFYGMEATKEQFYKIEQNKWGE